MIWCPVSAAIFSVQMEWQSDERIRDLKRTVETHTTQLDGIGQTLVEMDNGGKV